MELKTSNIMIFVALIAGAAHIMLFQNHIWSNFMWLSAMISVGIPLAIYRFMKLGEKRKELRRAEKYAEI